MPAVFRTSRRVEFCDTDMAGIVHFANFFRYMESAEVEFLRSLGLSVTGRNEAEHIGLPRVAASCDYLRPARFEDVLDIEVSILKLGRKSVTYGFEFFKQGAAIARGQVTSVSCRVLSDKQLESVELPEGMRRKLEQAAARP